MVHSSYLHPHEPIPTTRTSLQFLKVRPTAAEEQGLVPVASGNKGPGLHQSLLLPSLCQAIQASSSTFTLPYALKLPDTYFPAAFPSYTCQVL